MCYSPSDATNEIKKRLSAGSQNVYFCSHAQDRMYQRDIDDKQIISALRSGRVVAVENTENGECRYKVQSNLNGGITVMVEIPCASSNIIVITTWSK